MTGERLVGSESIFFKADASGNAGGANSGQSLEGQSMPQQIQAWHQRVEDLQKRPGVPAWDGRRGPIPDSNNQSVSAQPKNTG